MKRFVSSAYSSKYMYRRRDVIVNADTLAIQHFDSFFSFKSSRILKYDVFFTIRCLVSQTNALNSCKKRSIILKLISLQ